MSLISNPARVYQITCHEDLRFEQVASLRSEILVIEFYTPGLTSIYLQYFMLILHMGGGFSRFYMINSSVSR